jgi:transcriptional regulator GlxA family with amidase domain
MADEQRPIIARDLLETTGLSMGRIAESRGIDAATNLRLYFIRHMAFRRAATASNLGENGGPRESSGCIDRCTGCWLNRARPHFVSGSQ